LLLKTVSSNGVDLVCVCSQNKHFIDVLLINYPQVSKDKNYIDLLMRY
jgi:hypothetical protein